MSEKQWNGRPFWGVGEAYDPIWSMTPSQRKLQQDLIDLCQKIIRPNAIELDESREEFPYKSLEAMQRLGLMGLLVPKEFGGLGESHQFAAMVVETVARYGCASTAMVYVMHSVAIASVCFRHHHNDALKALMRRVATDKKPYLGTVCASDPSTGGHFWNVLSSKTRKNVDGTFQYLKYGSWATSVGFAEWYFCQALSPHYDGDSSKFSNFLLYKEEMRANTADWVAIGMRGNQSGPSVGEAKLTPDRLIGSIDESPIFNDEIVDIFFLLLSSACWAGLGTGTIDVGRKHVVGREHADTGLRIADYQTIQDYFGDALCAASSVRMFVLCVAQALDSKTDNCNWSLHSDTTLLPRTPLLQWTWMLKFEAAKMCGQVPEVMLHACGGTGFKKQLGLERLLRDAKAGWVMGPSNEVLRGLVGTTSLFGFGVLDFWCNSYNSRALTSELRKMSPDEKRELAHSLLKETESDGPGSPHGDTEDFWNPLDGGVKQPDTPIKCSLVQRTPLAEEMEEYTFEAASVIPGAAGQYIQLDLSEVAGEDCRRYLSPVSLCGTPCISLAVKMETSGIMSHALSNMQLGSNVNIYTPCGGYVHRRNAFKCLTLICNGIGVTPAVQVIRAIAADPEDNIKVNMLYHADKPSELVYKKELDEAMNGDKKKRFRIIYSVTELDAAWTGEEGYIGRDMILRHVGTESLDQARVLVCGGPSVIVASLYALKSIGIPSDAIYVYGPFGAEFMRKIYGRNTALWRD